MTQDKIRNTSNSEAATIADKPHIHPIYCFVDGSIVLQVQKQLFRVHHSFLSHLSPFFSALGTPEADAPNNLVDLSDRVSAHDLEVLLGHLYHDIPLSTDSPIDHFESILRISSPRQLNFPSVHATSKSVFTGKFPHGPSPSYRPTNILEALTLATEYHLEPVRKVLLYSIITSNEFDFHDTTVEPPPRPDNPAEFETPITYRKVLSADNGRTCSDLMTKLIEYFTPLLFTPATTPHMACTDVFADKWMPFVIQPAIENAGVTKPLETLEQMKLIDWARQGLCDSCVVEKREEWTSEQHLIWEMMDSWLKVK